MTLVLQEPEPAIVKTCNERCGEERGLNDAKYITEKSALVLWLGLSSHRCFRHT